MDPSFRHPYRNLPPESFWKTAVAEPTLEEFDPITVLPFRIAKTDRVATAGSCFAQHISKALMREGIHFLQVEKANEDEAAKLPVYSARYGNIYTCRQLLQLFQRAYGLFTPQKTAWQRKDGRYVDSFRPNEFPAGFATIEDVEDASDLHLAAVREVFETCDVFVFTLGLTEVWLSDSDGSAVPLPPGVVASPLDQDTRFSPANLSVQELSADLLAFIDEIRLVNPAVRILITVSPVPIIATLEERHVIVSNAYTKAVLRVVAQTATNERTGVLYFPSYEMIVTHPKARYFEDNYRAVRSEGVEAVMKVFRRRILLSDTMGEADHGLNAATSPTPAPNVPLVHPTQPVAMPITALESEFKIVICDEEMLAQTVGA